MLFSCFFMACNHRFLNLQMCRSYFLKAVCWRHCDQFLHADPKADPGLIVFRCEELSAASVAIKHDFCLSFATMPDLVASSQKPEQHYTTIVKATHRPNIAIPTMSMQRLPAVQTCRQGFGTASRSSPREAETAVV